MTPASSNAAEPCSPCLDQRLQQLPVDVPEATSLAPAMLVGARPDVDGWSPESSSRSQAPYAMAAGADQADLTGAACRTEFVWEVCFRQLPISWLPLIGTS